MDGKGIKDSLRVEVHIQILKCGKTVINQLWDQDLCIVIPQIYLDIGRAVNEEIIEHFVRQLFQPKRTLINDGGILLPLLFGKIR